MNNLQKLKAKEKKFDILKTDKARADGQRELLLAGLKTDFDVNNLHGAKILLGQLKDDLVEVEESTDAQDLYVEELINSIKGNNND
jgi:hypothetical protein